MVKVFDTYTYLDTLQGHILGTIQEPPAQFMRAMAKEIYQGATVYTYVNHGTYRKAKVLSIDYTGGGITLNIPNPINPQSRVWTVTLADLYIKVD
jgi:hypothetical protein